MEPKETFLASCGFWWTLDDKDDIESSSKGVFLRKF